MIRAMKERVAAMREMTVGTWLDPGRGREGQASPGTWSSNRAWKAEKGKGARIDTCGAGLHAECTDAHDSFYTDLLGTYCVLHGGRSRLHAVGKAALASAGVPSWRGGQ